MDIKARRANAKVMKKKTGGAVAASGQRLRDMKKYTEFDPGFDTAAMTEKLSRLYVQMQQCWTAKDLEPLRPYMTDAFFNQSAGQLRQMAEAGQTNYVERIAVLSCTLTGWYRDKVNDHVFARLNTRIVDYTLDDASGKLVSGSKMKEKFMTYEWELIRPTGSTTQPEDSLRSVSCPHCGAPLSINESARCQYCDSVVTVHEHDFVISGIRGISQKTGRR